MVDADHDRPVSSDGVSNEEMLAAAIATAMGIEGAPKYREIGAYLLDGRVEVSGKFDLKAIASRINAWAHS